MCQLNIIQVMASDSGDGNLHMESATKYAQAIIH